MRGPPSHHEMGKATMTDMPQQSPDGNASPAQQALTTLAGTSDDVAALDTLAASDVLVPVPAGAQDPEQPDQVMLPVIEQDGEHQVPVFTSEPRLAQALPGVENYLKIPLGVLAARWPSDDVMLTIDAGVPEALTLPAEGVRTLLARDA